jgi:asparagine synthase (glutamine-hydrolysing)
MCGIAGYYKFKPLESAQTLSLMAAAIQHRGPDDEGYAFVNHDDRSSNTYSSSRSPDLVKSVWPVLPSSQNVSPHHVGLAHVRYSVIDLSAGGHQPMWSDCRKVCLTFNGEIYNYLELRQELAQYGFVFRTKSDSEVLLAAYLYWGDQVFPRLNGFFAIAIYDQRRKGVLLARDRLGKAHLYLTRHPNTGIFWASEIKAFISAGCIDRSNVETVAVADFLLHGRRDQAGTFWREVDDFPPGHYAWITPDNAWNPQRYWSLPTIRLTSADLSVEEATLGLRSILCNALDIRLRADVPIAFELSGGMDSSALVGLAAGALGKKFTTYTIEFAEAHANEEAFARAVASRYPQQIDYRVIKPLTNDFWSEADRFVWLQEEPFHAPNLQTNQHLRRLLKQHGAHVVITGAAGDEMLAGYAGEYFPPLLRHLLAHFEFRDFIHELRSNTEISSSRALAHLLADQLLSDKTRSGLLKWRSGEASLLKRVLAPEILAAPTHQIGRSDEQSFHGRTVANMTYRLMNYWLRSGAKSDYGIPIESRAPFLDYRVVEYCCQLPPEFLIHDGWQKYLLRMAVADLLPKQVVWRRQKMGFPFPIREWLFESRDLAIRNAVGIDCPYINVKALFDSYSDFIKVAPITLWRLLSLILWWRRVIEDRPIFGS